MWAGLSSVCGVQIGFLHIRKRPKVLGMCALVLTAAPTSLDKTNASRIPLPLQQDACTTYPVATQKNRLHLSAC
ncbi:hypothetical protein DL89DRAFT_263990 [Linderina pennispora]|uniref:Uncharacterized protein n=1 Tax=Linderina pennispora TaxID=61395 RepID=A0A1Y1WK77_9FUNG|nr:uncharacterized protein DL89DRAFT_263990 [Linderina pennispora]ORX73990.1 hypothetical protein DL89DRAFT_263990 [Linderina pennispora]